MFAHMPLHKFPIHILHIRMVGGPEIFLDWHTE